MRRRDDGAFADQVLDGGARRREEPGGEAVGDEAVDLLRHVADEAAQARLDVRDGDAEFGGGERAGERAVGVAVDDDGVGRFALHHRLKSLEHLRRLARVRAGADAEVVVGLRQRQLLEEDVGHAGIVMLAGVHEDLGVVWRTTRENAAALMNCGRAPTTVRKRMAGNSKQQTANSVSGTAKANSKEQTAGDALSIMVRVELRLDVGDDVEALERGLARVAKVDAGERVEARRQFLARERRDVRQLVDLADQFVARDGGAALREEDLGVVRVQQLLGHADQLFVHLFARTEAGVRRSGCRGRAPGP